MDQKTNKEYFFKELNSICSYLAMFPLDVPEKYIKKYTKVGDIVYDPFSGRGTTALAAIKNDRIAFSNDLSPLAYVLTRAKNYNINTNLAITFVKKLEAKYNVWIKENFTSKNDVIFDNIRVFYSEKNLNQMLFLRRELGENYKNLSKIYNYILAIALGIMHGQTRKNGDSIYFSVSMPNGYSMSPNYANNYIKKNNLALIETNIFDQIINRIKSKPASFIEKDIDNKVWNKDALKSSSFVKEKPDLIFTSPPYLNIVKYVSQNWIRFWILGKDKEETKEKIVDDFHNINSYKEFLVSFLLEMEKIMKPSTKLMLVIGDVKYFKIKDTIKEILLQTNLKQIKPAVEQQLRRKLSSQMGIKKGRATPKDWIFELKLK